MCILFCPRLPNLRRDKYNRKLKKYYVIHEEGDEELSEEEEQQIQKDDEAVINMSQNNIPNSLFSTTISSFVP